jgi:hypothetical protein
MNVKNDLQAPPAAMRNAAPILEVLRPLLSPPAFNGTRVLEIAAGSGFHAATFARALPHLTWQPSDADAAARASIAAYAVREGLPNLLAPVALDVCAFPWPVLKTDAVLCINMIHISPWAATAALFDGAARLMPGRGLVITYGPYAIDGDFLAESNVAFDESLRSRNPAWGLRDVNDVASMARTHGFTHDETVPMPANNLMLVFRKADARS